MPRRAAYEKEQDMDLIKCPVCGELYSDSYPRCPFCEEEDDSPGLRVRRSGHRIADRSKAQSARGGMIAVLILVLALLGWYLFGDNIIRSGNNKHDADPLPISDREPAVPASVTDPSSGEEDPAANGQDANAETAEPPIDVNVDVTNAKLNRDDFTLSYAGEKYTIKLSGTEATPRWSIDNANVASIAADGTVTAVANGTTTVHCKVGTKDLTCTVRVRNTGKTAAPAEAPTVAQDTKPSAEAPSQNTAAPSQGSSTPSPSPAAPQGSAAAAAGTTHVDASSLSVKTGYGTTLQKDPSSGYPDCTVRINGDPIKLLITGTDVPVSGWSSDNTSVVTIAADGSLTPVSTGTAHVTATVGDAKITCIIRVR